MATLRDVPTPATQRDNRSHASEARRAAATQGSPHPNANAPQCQPTPGSDKDNAMIILRKVLRCPECSPGLRPSRQEAEFHGPRPRQYPSRWGPPRFSAGTATRRIDRGAWPAAPSPERATCSAAHSKNPDGPRWWPHPARRDFPARPLRPSLAPACRRFCPFRNPPSCRCPDPRDTPPFRRPLWGEGWRAENVVSSLGWRIVMRGRRVPPSSDRTLRNLLRVYNRKDR